MAKKKKYVYDKSERKFRAGTFFAGLLSIVAAAAFIIGMTAVGIGIFFGEGKIEDETATVLMLVTGLGLIFPLLFAGIGIIVAIPLIIVGALDFTHGFLPDRFYKKSVAYNIVISVIVLAVSVGITFITPFVADLEGMSILIYGLAAFGVLTSVLRLLSLLWFGIRCKLGKADLEDRGPRYVINHNNGENVAPAPQRPVGLDETTQSPNASKDGYIDPFNR